MANDPLNPNVHYSAENQRLDEILRTGSLCSPSRNNTLTGANLSALTEADRQAYLRQLFGDAAICVAVEG